MRIRLAVLALLLAMSLAGCQSSQVATKGQAIHVSDDVSLQPIGSGMWVYTTYFEVPNTGRIGANGLIVVNGEDAVLINLPWTDAQTAALFDWVAKNSGATVKAVIPTHFHQDCMGGLAEAHRRGATSYALDKTIEFARRDHLPVPQNPFRLRTAVRCGSTIILLAYPGAGHTTDNIVAWLLREQVLFGGCLIKSLEEQSLGNTSDGDVAAYPTTLQKVKTAYRNARIVVPGHGDPGGPGLIDHTLKLCNTKTTQ